MPRKKGRKILIRANTDAELATMLRDLAKLVEQGNEFANVVLPVGVRIMRPLRTEESDWYLSARDLP